MEIYQRSSISLAIEENRERDRGFEALTESIVGRGPEPYNGKSARLDRALKELGESVDWAEHPSIKYHDRPEDMEPDAAEAPELARRA